MPAVHKDIQASDKEEKNPHFPVWKTWILISLIVSQILTAVQIRQANEELWKAVIQFSSPKRSASERNTFLYLP